MGLYNGTVKLDIKLTGGCTPPCHTTGVKLSQAVPTPYLQHTVNFNLHELAEALSCIYTTPRSVTWASVSQCPKLSSLLCPAVGPFALCTLLRSKGHACVYTYMLEDRLLQKVYFEDAWQVVSSKVHVLYMGAKPVDKRHKSCPGRCLKTDERQVQRVKIQITAWHLQPRSNMFNVLEGYVIVAQIANVLGVFSP